MYCNLLFRRSHADGILKARKKNQGLSSERRALSLEKAYGPNDFWLKTQSSSLMAFEV
jgi:hypothetical protein